MASLGGEEMERIPTTTCYTSKVKKEKLKMNMASNISEALHVMNATYSILSLT